MIQQNNNLQIQQQQEYTPGILLTNNSNINASSTTTMTTSSCDTKAIIELESNSTLNRALTTLLKKSFFEQKPVNWRPVKFELVINSKLTEEFTQIKSDFQKISKELQSKDPKEECDYTEKYGFLIESDPQVNYICQNGYFCTETSYNVLGQSKCGVYVCKYVDTCLKYAENKKFPENITLKMILFKTCYGRHTTTVIRKPNPRLQPILPTVGFNSHSSVIAPKEGADIETQFDHSQIYLYELYNDKVSAKKPRNCLPYAVVTWLKFNDGTEWPHNFDELEGDVNLLQTDTIQIGLGTDDVYLKNKLKDILKANEEVKCDNEGRNEHVNEANGLNINNSNTENIINNGQNNNSNTGCTAENNDTNNITGNSCDVSNESHNNNQEIESSSSQSNKTNNDNLINEQTQQITTENGNNEDKSPLNGYNNNNNISPSTTAGGSTNLTTSANNVSNQIATTNVNNNSQNGSTPTATTANTTVTTTSSTNNTNTSVTPTTSTNPTTTTTVSSSISVPSSNSYYNKTNGSHYQKQMHSYQYRQNPAITPYILTQTPSPYSTIRLPYLAAQPSTPTAASLYAAGTPYGGIATQTLQQPVYLCRAPNGSLTYITATPSAHMLSNHAAAAAQATTYIQQPSATTYAAPPTAYKIPTVNQLSSYQSPAPQQSQPQQQIIYQAAPQPAQTSTAAAKQNMIPTANNIVVQPQQTAQALQAAATTQQQAQAVAQAQVNVHAQHAPPTQSPKQNTASSATTQQQTTQFATQFPGQNPSALYATQNQLNQQMQQINATYQGQPTYVTYAPTGANNIATSLAGQTYYANPSSYIVTQSGTSPQLATAAAQGGVYGYTTQLANVTNGYATQNPTNGQISMTLPSGAQGPAGYQIIDYRQVGGIPTAATTVQLDQFAQSATGLVQRPRFVNVKYHPYPRN